MGDLTMKRAHVTLGGYTLIVTMGVLLLFTPSQSAYTESLPTRTSQEVGKMSQEQASAFARLALKGIQKEYPNKPGDVLNSAKDIKGPQAMHPAFYGCLDWHSSVHGHWLLVRLLRLFPELPERKEIRAVLAEHLNAKNLQA